MIPREALRLLSPVGWVVAVVVIVSAVVLLGRGAGLRWDPFGLGARRLEQAEQQASVATAEARARSLEAEAVVEQARRLEQQHQQAVDLARVTAVAGAAARTAHDSRTPLDPARVDRIGAHDRELCRLAPTLCVAPKADPAANDPFALSAGPVAGRADNLGS